MVRITGLGESGPAVQFLVVAPRGIEPLNLRLVSRTRIERVQPKEVNMANIKQCPYPTSKRKCVRSASGLCCIECNHYRICVEACKNVPDKCGRDQ